MIGCRSYDQLRSSHRGWIEEYLGNGAKSREDEWTDSIAVGRKPFIEKVKALLGFKAKGRVVIEGGEGVSSPGGSYSLYGHFQGLKRR